MKYRKTFRISQTDLKVRPVYRRLKNRIEAHLRIAFCAYKVCKESERQLKLKKAYMSAEKVIEILKTIYALTIITPYSKKAESRPVINTPEQELIWKIFNP